MISFVVSEDFERTIRNIVITPNPMIDEGSFVIDSDLPDGLITVEIETFDELGRRVHQSSERLRSTNGMITGQLDDVFSLHGTYVIYFTLSSSSLGERKLSRAEKVLFLK